MTVPIWTPPGIITSCGEWGIGDFLQAQNLATQSGGGAVAWPSGSLAIYCPIVIPAPIIAVMLAVGNGAVGNNIDVGIYDQAGTLIVSSGSTAMSGTSATQTFDISDTVIGPGLFYLAAAIDGTTGGILRANPGAAGAALLQAAGVAQQASAFPLPANAVFASMAQAYLPIILLSIQTVV